MAEALAGTSRFPRRDAGVLVGVGCDGTLALPCPRAATPGAAADLTTPASRPAWKKTMSATASVAHASTSTTGQRARRDRRDRRDRREPTARKGPRELA